MYALPPFPHSPIPPFSLSPFFLRRWLLHVGGGFVCPCRWFAFGVSFGRSAGAVVSFVHIVGLRLALVLVVRGGGFVCLNRQSAFVLVVAVVSFLGSAPRVGRPSRNFAKK